MSLGVALASTARADGRRAEAPSRVEDLQTLSIDQLADLPVTSVSKREQPLSAAPASIYVITHDDIMRLGEQRLPEILRLAPNLQVSQTNATQWVISARGLSGNLADQSYSNKLLVLIDGRTVYTPLFSGVYWDMQDVPPEDIERIEVISGPGATLWGANAVNGVINIITRKAAETQGLAIDAGAGGGPGGGMGYLTLQYGGRSDGGRAAWRVYAKDDRYGDTLTATGARTGDGWSKPQAGFRLDWNASPRDLVTVQGDAWRGTNGLGAAPDEKISGGNALARWTHETDGGSSIQTQAYVDRLQRKSDGRFWQNTFDLEVQDALPALGRHRILLGAGVRSVDYAIHSNGSLIFDPARSRLLLGDAFVQDTMALSRTLELTAGLKLEDPAYLSVQALPSLRLAWRPDADHMAWAAVSRAIRAPTPFDRDVVEKVGAVTLLTGDKSLPAMTLVAYEAGTRLQPAPGVSLSVSAYYDVYDGIRTIEPTPATFFPLTWGSGLRGEIYGVDAWADWQARSWWKLRASVSALHENLGFAPGASGILGPSQAGDDAPFRASLRSSMNLGRAVTLDGDLRYVAALPDPEVPAYTELNARLGWNVGGRVQLALVGLNLLHPQHLEFPLGQANEIPRSVFAQLRLRY